MPPSTARFKSAMRHLPTSVVVAAGMTADATPVGMLIGSFTSVSLTPLLVGFLGDHNSTTFPTLLTLDHVTFSVLSDDDETTPEAFRLPADERFLKAKWSITPYGTPVIDGAVLAVHTKKHSTHPAGDHTMVLLEVLDTTPPALHRRPLIYAEGRMTRLA
ncbi:MAG: flavin reductase family protein [Saccharothrix sp.]|nr:flavin reductase family protein [Saccharothrix sp.]